VFARSFVDNEKRKNKRTVQRRKSIISEIKLVTCCITGDDK
jgi:hypothetical protein